MFSVHVPKLARSAGFRFALLNTFVFVISVFFIAWVAETALTAALQRQARDRVETETASLLAAYQHEGLTGLRAAISEPRRAKGGFTTPSSIPKNRQSSETATSRNSPAR